MHAAGGPACELGTPGVRLNTAGARAIGTGMAAAPSPVDDPSRYGNPAGVTFRQLLAEDFRTHGRAWTSPGFRAVAVHRFGNWRMGVRSRVLRVPLSVLYRALFRRVRRNYGIEIDFSTRLGRRVVIDHQSGIVVSGFAAIGDDCRLRQNVTIGIRAEGDLRAPVLGNGVDLGAGAVLLGGITVGDGAIIGANAVVLTDVPAGALAVGVPATIKVRPAS